MRGFGEIYLTYLTHLTARLVVMAGGVRYGSVIVHHYLTPTMSGRGSF
jgi:hypothetical protein